MTWTVGELARQAGVSVRTLQHWDEVGLLVPSARTGAGHRRYDEHDVELVQQVLRRRDGGMRLEVAIAGVALAEASVAGPPGAPSIFATMRRTHPTPERSGRPMWRYDA